MTNINLIYLYLLSPLHTGGTTQEGNLLGIARESHTNLPYIPSSTIRGRLRSSIPSDQTIEINGQQKSKKFFLFGNEIDGGEQLEQGAIWIGDGSLLWIPVASLSHGVVWVSSPSLLRRWLRFSSNRQNSQLMQIPSAYQTNLPTETPVYLKDAIFPAGKLQQWEDWGKYIPKYSASLGIDKVLVLPDQHCTTVVQMSLWRQVKIKLNEHKSVDEGFRYEEAIPPDTLMYFPWGVTSQAHSSNTNSQQDNSPNSNDADKLFRELLNSSDILQIGGQESLGRGFVQLMYDT